MSREAQAELVAHLIGTQPGPPSGAEGALKVLPVRLPAQDYERLREWSRDQGFSMAVIIRTLVKRFLDEQRGRPSQPGPA